MSEYRAGLQFHLEFAGDVERIYCKMDGKNKLVVHRTETKV